MEKVKNILGTLIFNVAETALILLIGMLLALPIRDVIMIMLTFMISRGFFGNALHFKTWYRCLVWSSLILLSLFLILNVDIVLSTLFTIFAAFIMTGKSNIADLYLWNNRNEPSKYQDVADYVKYHSLDDKLIEFENKIKERDALEYLVYKYRFIDGKTFNEISLLLDMETSRISQLLDKVTFALRIYCGI